MSFSQKILDSFDKYVLKKYKIVKLLGVGSNGSVVKAKNILTGQEVAIKRIDQIFDDLIYSKRILREISILGKLNHPNIIKIIEVIMPENEKHFNEIYIVFEYVPIDWQKLFKSKIYLKKNQVKKIIYQIINSIRYLHSAGILHRDLKPANIWINNNCMIKLCDFGLARSFIENIENNEIIKKDRDINKNKKYNWTSHIVTRWYRAPELILIEKNYNSKIDIWSLGCIFSELFNTLKEQCENYLDRKPLFPGKSCYPLSPDISFNKSNDYPIPKNDQMNIILSILGSPRDKDLDFITKNKIKKYINLFNFFPKFNLYKKYQNIDKQYIDLLEKILKFNPNDRITLEECLKYPIFKDIRNKSSEFIEKEKLYFEYENKDLNSENDIRKYFLKEISVYNN